jgi:rhodanese-related sulfurtransferase
VPYKSYAGDISGREAWRMLADDPEAVLVDVRSKAEWSFVGVSDLSDLGKAMAFVEWQSFPGMVSNDGFAEELRESGVSSDRTVIFICRSGQRSMYAAVAMTKRGYERCFNLAGGFEGPLDDEGHRGRRDGWKAAGLPWKQD